MPRTLPIFKEYSNRLLDHLNHAYFTPISYKDHIQAFEQIQILRSIRKKIKKHNLLIRLTDKSNNFYIGLTSEFEKKVQQFFSDTNAFMELSYNPFHEILNRVIQLLNQLQSKRLITLWQYNQMVPDRTKCELAHLYFNPKTHKVYYKIFSNNLSYYCISLRMVYQFDPLKVPCVLRQEKFPNFSTNLYVQFSMINVVQPILLMVPH